MPTPDASQFTQLKKYTAIASRRVEGEPQSRTLSHLHQSVPSVVRPLDFLASFTNKYTSNNTLTRINVNTGRHAKPKVPAGFGNPGAILKNPVPRGSRLATNGIFVVGFLLYDQRWANPSQGNVWWLDSQFGTLIFDTRLNNGNPWYYENTAYGDVFAYFINLQAKGAKIILSLGGETATIATLIPNTTVATNLGESMAFLCTGTGSNPLFFPLMKDHNNNSFRFDGIDFDFENNAATDTTTVTTLLTTLRTAAPSAVITCAPQPAYLFPGITIPYQYPSAFNANGAYAAYADINAELTSLNPRTTNNAALLDVDNISNFTYILMQYYNQNADQYPGGQSFSQILAQLAYLAQTSTNKPKIYIGLLSNIQGGSYPNPIPPALSLVTPIETGINQAQAKLVAAGKTVTISDWLGGIFVWDSPSANSYGSTIVSNSTILSALPKPLVLYGGQEWSLTGPENPGW